MKWLKYVFSAVVILAFVGCAATSKFEEERLTYPIVVKSMVDCSDVAVFIGEWIDENGDMTFDESEWFVYVSDRLSPMERVEYLVPEGMYVIKAIKESEGIEAWTVGSIPQPDLKPNEKTTLIIECGTFKEKGEDHQCPNDHRKDREA